MYKISDYPEIQNNFYLGGRNEGASRKLVGDVNIVTVFLRRHASDWSEDAKSRYYTCAANAADFLNGEAKRYGARLNIQCFYLETDVPYNANARDGFALLKNYVHSSTVEELQRNYERRMGVDEVPILLAFNEDGRSFAFKKNKYNAYNTEEISVIFLDADTDTAQGARAIAHELLHQFGAVDYYFPQMIKDAAEKYLHNSIMGIGESVVDDLTAYLVGWKDTISAGTYWFLHDTMWMNAQRYVESLKNEWKNK